MKKAPSKRKKTKRRKHTNINDSVQRSKLSGFITNIGSGNKRNWLWLFISVFFFIWLGSHLIEAFTTFSIQDLRNPGLVPFDEHPIWFSFVASFKLVAWIASGIYIWLIIKELAGE